MQYCIWDHLKQLADEDARRATHLARLAAHLVQAKALPIIALRVSAPLTASFKLPSIPQAMSLA